MTRSTININACPTLSLVNFVPTATTVPANALLDDQGIPILDENGNYILLD